MKPQEKILKRLRELKEEGSELENEVDYGDLDGHCQAWLVAVKSMLHSLFGDSHHPYRSEIESICEEDRGADPMDSVGRVTAILERLISDLDADLIFSIENRTRAAVFEDFLDDAKSFVKANDHREAGVLSSAVFEDAIRSVARKNGIAEEGIKTDQIITELTNKGVLSAVKAKRARSSAGIRNKAMHAKWDEFDLDDVNSLIRFTGELITLLDEN